MFSSSVYSMCGEDWDGGEWLDESVLERLAWWIGPRLNARPGDATGAGALACVTYGARCSRRDRVGNVNVSWNACRYVMSKRIARAVTSHSELRSGE
jgi:hypothetical protein